MKKGKTLIGLMAAVAIVVVVAGMGTEARGVGVVEQAGSGTHRPDIVMIDAMKVFGDLEAEAVTFLHDRHTNALRQEGKDCTSCHFTDKQKNQVTGKNRLSVSYMREDGDVKMDQSAMKALYHDNCFACHQEMKAAAKQTGPVEGECRSCHNAKPEVVSNWTSIGLDKSLHYRHVASKDIKSLTADKENCSHCHQVFDDAKKKFVYEKGTEDSCRTCHPAVATEKQSSMADISHKDCVSCHLDIATEGKDSGPLQCAGCHSASEQKLIKQVKDVPRLDRNQPDAVLMGAWQGVAPGAKASAAAMAPVAFDHEAHEAANDSCRVCHHSGIKSCAKTCHTLKGAEEGKYIQLEEAMHDKNSMQSCVGCHAKAQEAKECAGCHSFMPAGPQSPEDCKTCHVEPAAGTLAATVVAEAVKGVEPAKEVAQAAALSLIQDRVNRYTYTADEIPETVKIDGMVDKFEAVDFPHRKIVESIVAKVKDNKMADSFHSNKWTLCQGCHHNSPLTKTPPRCSSCHGKPFKEGESMKPGLKGAYHGQCIGCHQEMGIEKPAATECAGCHAKRK